MVILCGPTTYNNGNYGFTVFYYCVLFKSQHNIFSRHTFVYAEKHANSVSRSVPVVQAIFPQFFPRDWV